MAPALIIGVDGRPVPSSRLMGLNASPLGATPTRSSTPSRPTAARARAKEPGSAVDSCGM